MTRSSPSKFKRSRFEVAPTFPARAVNLPELDRTRARAASVVQDFELIVVDDGSTDGKTSARLQELAQVRLLYPRSDASNLLRRLQKEPRMVLIKHPTNLGLVAALQTGLQRATAPFVARMDSDDVRLRGAVFHAAHSSRGVRCLQICEPTRLEVQCACLEAHPEVAVVGTSVQMFAHSDPSRTVPSAARVACKRRSDVHFCGHGFVFVVAGFAAHHSSPNRCGTRALDHALLLLSGPSLCHVSPHAFGHRSLSLLPIHLCPGRRL
jgi:hypothetical protein